MNSQLQTAIPKLNPKSLLSALKDFNQALPVRKEALDLALQALRHPQANAQRVADAIGRDPAMTLELILHTNQQLLRQGTEARYLHHCISLLGMPQVERILRQVPSYSTRDDDKLLYEEQLNQSWLAADLCQQLQLGSNEESQSLFISCLTIRFHELALWCHYPQAMHTIERLKASPLYSHDQIEERVLGTTINKLGIQLASHWPLPELAQTCWQDGFHLNTKANPDSIHRPNCLKLCHVVSSLGCRNWYHGETLSAQKLLAKESRRSPEFVVNACHQSAIKAPLKGWQELHPGNRLLQYWNYQQTLEPLLLDQGQSDNPETLLGSNVDNVPPSAEINHNELEKLLHSHHQAEQGDARFLRESLEALSRRGHEFKDLNQLLLHSLSTIHQGLGLEDVAIMVLNNSRDQLRAQYCQGNKDLPGLRVRLNSAKPGLFEKLMQQRASILINEQSSAQIIAQIPAELDDIFAPQGLGFMSLFHHKQPVGLLIVHSDHLDSEIFQQVKRIGSATSSAISALAREKYRRKTALNKN
jgi:HD-like signal output (HDOD) protein